MAWTAKVVEVDATATVVRTLVNCNISTVPIDPMNPRGAEHATITIPKHETGGAVGQYADIELGREIQIWEDATLRFWGVPMTRRGASGQGEITIDVYDLGWYFTKSNIDAPVRNLLTNGDMEAGTGSWTGTSVTVASETTVVRRGTKALRLTGASTFGEQYVEQSVVVTGTAVGTELTASAYFYIDSFTGPALRSRGLYLESLDTGVVETYNDHEGVIDADTALALDEWQRVEATIWVPPLATRTIKVRLYAPNGQVVWDEVGLFKPTSLAIAPGSPEDIAETANRIVSFIQDSTYGKSTKRITQATSVTSGIEFTFPKAYLYEDHTPADVALGEIQALGVDMNIAIDADTKQFTTHHPSKGSDLTGSITLSLTTNVASYTYEENHDEVETEVTILGDGDGPDREEGYAEDTSDVGGMVLQGVTPAPPGATIDKLDALAEARLALKKKPVKTLKVVTKGPLAVTTGDRVDVGITEGVIAISGTWRIVSGSYLTRSEGAMELNLVEYA